MLNAIYCEFLKLKRTFFYPAIIFISFPFMVIVEQSKNDKLFWNSYIPKIEMTNFMSIYVFLFAIIIGYVFTREFTDNVAAMHYSYPLGKINIFLSKFIFVTIIVILIYVFQLVFAIIGGLMMPHEPLTMEILIPHIKINLLSLFYQVTLIPLTIFVSLLGRNIIVPFIYSVLLLFVNVYSLNVSKEIAQIIPFSLPLTPMFSAMGENINTISVSPNSVLVSIITFVIGFSLCLIYHVKADIM